MEQKRNEIEQKLIVSDTRVKCDFDGTCMPLGVTVTFSSAYAQSAAVKRNVEFPFLSSFSTARLHTKFQWCDVIGSNMEQNISSGIQPDSLAVCCNRKIICNARKSIHNKLTKMGMVATPKFETLSTSLTRNEFVCGLTFRASTS